MSQGTYAFCPTELAESPVVASGLDILNPVEDRCLRVPSASPLCDLAHLTLNSRPADRPAARCPLPLPATAQSPGCPLRKAPERGSPGEQPHQLCLSSCPHPACLAGNRALRGPRSSGSCRAARRGRACMWRRGRGGRRGRHASEPQPRRQSGAAVTPPAQPFQGAGGVPGVLKASKGPTPPP